MPARTHCGRSWQASEMDARDVVLTPVQARRVAVRAQLLDEPRPSTPLETIRRLSLVQADLTDAVAPNADLVLISRLGDDYRPSELDALLDSGAVLEVRGMLRPAEDVALLRAEMTCWPGSGDDEPLKAWQVALAGWVQANDDCRRDILAALRDDGPLPASALPDTTLVPWRSSGWNNNKSVNRLLDQMIQRGEVALAGRKGRTPLFDLAERIYPDDPVPDPRAALRSRAQARLRSLGIARASGGERPGEAEHVGDAGVRARVEGLRGWWRLDPEALERLDEPLVGRTALLSPLDRLVFDRTRMEHLFGFDYQLEMHKPATRRRWGYFALPVLHGGDLIGKIDATSDRDRGVLRVDAIHRDEPPWSSNQQDGVEQELSVLANALDLQLDLGPTGRRAGE